LSVAAGTTIAGVLSVNNHIIGTGTIGVSSNPWSTFLTALDVSAGAVIDGVLSIAGYPDVKAAIDGKQPNLTSASNITTGTINANGDLVVSNGGVYWETHPMASADRLTTAWKCILPEVRAIFVC
jgi:hypothetical protein